MSTVSGDRHVGGFEKMDLRYDHMYLDLGSVGIIDPAFSICWEIHWIIYLNPSLVEISSEIIDDYLTFAHWCN